MSYSIKPAGKYCFVENLYLVIYVLTPGNYTGKQPPENRDKNTYCNSAGKQQQQKLDFYILKKLRSFMHACICIFLFILNILCIYTLHLLIH